MSVICRYLLSCEEPEYDSKLVESGQVLAAAPLALGPWTGEKSVYGRVVSENAMSRCLLCKHGRKTIIRGLTKVYCSYQP